MPAVLVRIRQKASDFSEISKMRMGLGEGPCYFRKINGYITCHIGSPLLLSCVNVSPDRKSNPRSAMQPSHIKEIWPKSRAALTAAIEAQYYCEHV